MSICTKEACAFRDAYEDFVAAGALVIGVSGDSAASHEEFAGKHRLPFLLAGDCRRGQSLVVWAVNEGRGAARAC